MTNQNNLTIKQASITITQIIVHNIMCIIQYNFSDLALFFINGVDALNSIHIDIALDFDELLV